jgi:plasmid stabilization system protein ParE
LSRFFFSPCAKRDLVDIKAYLDSVPQAPANKIARALQATFRSIAENPYQGVGQSALTRLAGVEVRSRLVDSYRILYTVGRSAPEIIGVLHTSRNIASIMAKRLQ